MSTLSASQVELLKRIGAGESIDLVLASHLQEGMAEALRRVALVTSFDERLFMSLVDGQPSSVTFRDVAAHPDVEPIPRSDRVFRMREERRETWIDRWRSDREAYLALRRRLADWYWQRTQEETDPESRGSAQRARLRQLVAVDPAAAAQLFQTLYQEAENAADLATCASLLDAVQREPVIDGLDESLLRLGSEHRRRLELRGLWLTDYHATTHFLPRSSLVQWVEGFMAPARDKNGDANHTWVVDLHAPGGAGKTMFVRWLISRWCGPHEIPCCRIDFDQPDPMGEIGTPWRLLLRMAERLNRQLPSAPFLELLRRYADDVAHSDVEGDGSGEEAGRQRHDDILLSLQEGLRTLVGRTPVLIVLDTLEEVLLRKPPALDSLIEDLARVHAGYPALRLVLSGRYSVSERLPNFRHRQAGVTRVEPVAPFDRTEAHRYLTAIRGLEPDSRAEAILDLSKGNPFKLALYADTVQEVPALSEAEIRETRSADLTYLIERVVERIENLKVRWLLRYGVIPRKLHRGFVKDVMQRYLIAVMSGKGDTLDNPLQDLPESMRTRRWFPQDVLQGSDDALDVDSLWRALGEFAATRSWISPGDDVDVFVFHSDVVNPMRRLLRAHPVHRDLHRDAVGYFEMRAKNDPRRWIRWTREAIYHAFQEQGPAAGSYWRTRIMTALRAGAHQACLELSEELLGSEYLDDGKPLPWSGGTPILSEETLCLAYHHKARAGALIARSLTGQKRNQLAADAKYAHRAALSSMRRLKKRSPVSAAEHRLVKVLIDRLSNPSAFASRPDLEALEAHDRLELLLLRGETLAGYDPAEALACFRDALDVADSLSLGSERFVALLLQAARTAMAVGDFDLALDWVENANALDFVGAEKGRGEIVLETGRVLVALGRFSQAEDVLSRSLTSSVWSEDDGPRRLLLATIRLDHRDFAGVQSMFVSSAQGKASGESAEVGALLHRERLRWDASVQAFDEAEVSYRRAGRRTDAQRCFWLGQEVLYHCLGQADRVERIASRTGRTATLPLNVRVRAELLLMHLAFRRRPAEAARQAHAVLSAAEAQPVLAVRAGIEILALIPPHMLPQGLKSILTNACRRLPAYGALVEALDLLVRCPALSPDAARYGSPLTWLAPLPDLDEPSAGLKLLVGLHLRRILRLPPELDALSRVRKLAKKGNSDIVLAIAKALDGAVLTGLGKWGDVSWSRWITPHLNRGPDDLPYALAHVHAHAHRLTAQGLHEEAEPFFLNAARWLGVWNDAQRAMDAAGFAARRIADWNADAYPRMTDWLVRDGWSVATFEQMLLVGLLQCAKAVAHGDRGGLTEAVAVWRRAAGVAATPFAEQIRTVLDKLAASVTTEEPTASSAFSSKSPTRRRTSQTPVVGGTGNVNVPATSYHGYPQQPFDLFVSVHLLRDANGMMVRHVWSDNGKSHGAGSKSSRFPALMPVELDAFWRGENQYHVLDALWHILSRGFPDPVAFNLSDYSLRVMFEDERLHALPWEAASLADGSSRPLTEHVRQFIRTTGRMPPPVSAPRHGEPLRVLVVEPSSNRQFLNFRGSVISAGQSAGRLWRSIPGVDVIVLEEPAPMMIREAMRKLRPAVLHLCAGFRDVSTGEGIVLDFQTEGEHFSSRDYDSQGSELSVRWLASELMSGATEDRRCALVLLDPPLPSTNLEAMRQLQLRNLFAGMLQASCDEVSMLAAGFLGEGYDIGDYGNLLTAIAQRAPLGEAVRVLRRPMRESPKYDGMLLGAALFSDAPDRPVW